MPQTRQNALKRVALSSSLVHNSETMDCNTVKLEVYLAQNPSHPSGRPRKLTSADPWNPLFLTKHWEMAELAAEEAARLPRIF